MDFVDGSFEASLTRRLRAELDALDVATAAVSPQSRRIRPVRIVWTIGRPLALALALALLLGSVAALASGSTDPSQWVREAKSSLGLPPSDDEGNPSGVQASPSPHAEDSPETTETPEPAEGGTQPGTPEREAPESPEPTEHRTPEPSSPGDSRSPEPGEGGASQSAGDD
jgi:hypothetical protein